MRKRGIMIEMEVNIYAITQSSLNHLNARVCGATCHYIHNNLDVITT
jgi:hypothetical protein